jgi:hypothetical protein
MAELADEEKNVTAGCRHFEKSCDRESNDKNNLRNIFAFRCGKRKLVSFAGQAEKYLEEVP